jgi:hypothetical protein
MKGFNSNFGNKYNKTPWVCQEINEFSTKQRQAYLKYKSLRTNDAYEEYKLMRNQVNQDIRKIKEDYWEGFSKNLEHDFCGIQKQIWRFIKNQKK